MGGLREIFQSRTLVTALHIVGDFFLTAVLLFSLVGIHSLLELTDFRPQFKELFGTIHEWIFMVNYLLLAAKGIVRLATAPWRE